ncbi:MAG TPA: hypothetical protein V6C99_10330 [Oculatellaceae cyanobacterium]
MEQPISPPPEPVAGDASPANIEANETLTQLMQNPAAYIRAIVEEEAIKHLARLKEEAELRGALNLFRKKNEDFARFEPLIMQEVADLIRNDPDGDIAPWDQLLEKGTERFREKFQAMMAEKAETLASSEAPPFLEGSGNRTAREVPPQFTREQIARMSLSEYLQNEAAIDEALRGKRIV